MSLTSQDDEVLSKQGYALHQILGEGSYAKVYLSSYTRQAIDNNSKLACKVIDTDKAPKDFIKKFFPRELEIIRKLDHPNVIKVHSIFHRGTKYFIFMRYAERGDILEFILKKGAVVEEQANIWFKQLLQAVKYLHSIEVAHRDIKCENVLLTANYNVKLADYGFSRYCVDEKGNRILSDTYCGSLSYAAPELIHGKPYNPKLSDVWSLGVVLYVMLNKAMPFDDSNVKKQYEQQMKRRWKFRSKVKNLLSVEVKEVVRNVLEPDIAKRWRIDHIVRSAWLMVSEKADEELQTEKIVEEEEELEDVEEEDEAEEEESLEMEVKKEEKQTTIASEEIINKPEVDIMKEGGHKMTKFIDSLQVPRHTQPFDSIKFVNENEEFYSVRNDSIDKGKRLKSSYVYNVTNPKNKTEGSKEKIKHGKSLSNKRYPTKVQEENKINKKDEAKREQVKSRKDTEKDHLTRKTIEENKHVSNENMKQSGQEGNVLEHKKKILAPTAYTVEYTDIGTEPSSRKLGFFQRLWCFKSSGSVSSMESLKEQQLSATSLQ